MKSLLITLTLATLLLSQVHADLARVSKLTADESIVISVTFIGTVPLTTRYTFTADKVIVQEGEKKIGEVALTPAEKKSVDHYIDLIRDGRHGTGNGSSIYFVTFFQKGRAARNFSEELEIRSPKAPEQGEKVLSLEDLRKRAAK